MRVAKIVLAIMFPLAAWPLYLNMQLFGRPGVAIVTVVISFHLGLGALASALATERSSRFLWSVNLLSAGIACIVFLGYVTLYPEVVFRGTDPRRWIYLVYAALVASPICFMCAWCTRFGIPQLLRATSKSVDEDSSHWGLRPHVPKPWELDPLNHPVILSRTQSPLRDDRLGEDARPPSSETPQ